MRRLPPAAVRRSSPAGGTPDAQTRRGSSLHPETVVFREEDVCKDAKKNGWGRGGGEAGDDVNAERYATTVNTRYVISY